MSLYTDAITSDPPRFAVFYGKDASGEDNYEWGMRGKIPVLQLIGAIGSVQTQLQAGEWMAECEHERPALILMYVREEGEFAVFKHPDIPALSLCGMLEVIKALIVASKVAQQNAANQFNLCGPDGKPMRR